MLTLVLRRARAHLGPQEGPCSPSVYRHPICLGPLVSVGWYLCFKGLFKTCHTRPSAGTSVHNENSENGTGSVAPW